MIEVEGLPEGWRAVAFRKRNKGDKYFYQNIVWTASADDSYPYLIVEKIQQREIRLVETNEYRQPMQWEYAEIRDDVFAMQGEEMVIDGPYKIWRNKVKETAIPLNSGEPKLSLSVEECKEMLTEYWGYELGVKIRKFIKENS